MKRSRISPSFHLSICFLIFLCIFMLNHIFSTFLLVILFIFFQKLYSFSFFKDSYKLLKILFGILLLFFPLVLFLPFITILFGYIRFIIFAMVLTSYINSHSRLERLYAAQYLLKPFTFIGIPVSQIVWNIECFFHNCSLFYQNLQLYDRNNLLVKQHFQKKVIYDKIETIKEKFQIVRKITQYEIQNMEEIMITKLFDCNISRTNYWIQRWQKKDKIFVILFLLLLASEVVV